MWRIKERYNKKERWKHYYWIQVTFNDLWHVVLPMQFTADRQLFRGNLNFPFYFIFDLDVVDKV